MSVALSQLVDEDSVAGESDGGVQTTRVPQLENKAASDPTAEMLNLPPTIGEEAWTWFNQCLMLESLKG
jgi:hypothetical protein